MSLLFLLLKFLKLFESAYDYILFLILIDLDIIAFINCLRWNKLKNR